MRKFPVYIILFLLLAVNSFAANIYSIEIDGAITASTSAIVKDGIKQASADNASILLININTPGGLLEETRVIVQDILASAIPVVTHVTPAGARAGSAGAFITLAADYAVMDNGTNIGAAHPVNATGEDIDGEMGKKVHNDTVAFMKSIAEKRGRNVEASIKMVSDSASYTASEALNLKVINAVAENSSDIASIIKDHFEIEADVNIIVLEQTFFQKVSNFLANPNTLVALFFIGVILLGLEFKMPGTFLFAGLGAAFLLLFAIGANIIPINFLGFAVILLGIAMLIAEIFVTSFGILAAGGIFCLLFGLRMLFDRSESMGLGVSLWVMILIAGIILAIVLTIGRLLLKDFVRKPASGMDTMVGKHAKVIDWKGESGRVTIYGEIWNAHADQELEVDDDVIVESFKDMALSVKKA